MKAYLKADEYLDLADPRGRELFGKTFEKTRKAIIDDGGGSLALCGDAEWDLFNASGYYGFPEYQEFMRTRQFLKDLPKRMTGTIHKLSNLGEEIWCMEQGKEEAPLEACEMETIPTLDHMPKGWCYATATTQHNMAYDMTCKLAFIVRRDMKAEVLVTEEMKGYVESNAYSDITDEKGLELFRTAFSGVRKALTVVGSTYTEAVLDILEICSHYGFPERDDLIGKNQSGMVRFYIAFDKLAGRGKSIWGCSSSGQITSR
ncbi:MAG: hypothetical protein SWQ30_12755 [Thermodesulfobacteriota bacterium]|nr:hypothetical protein [Thermodesulfobacteriota bacterium]